MRQVKVIIKVAEKFRIEGIEVESGVTL